MNIRLKITVESDANTQAGFVLMSILLLLSILSVSAFVAVEQSQLSYKINHARVAQMKARQISEDGRLAGLQQLEFLLADKNQTIHQQYSNQVADRFKNDGLKHLLSLNDGNAKAEVFLQALATKMLKNGTSLAQNMGYSGVGSGLGSLGSFSTHYELRAQGVVLDKGNDVEVWTASDFRFIPQ